MIKFLEGWKLWVVVIAGSAALVAMAWGAAGAIGIRPALIGEVAEVRAIAENNAQRLDADRFFILDRKRKTLGLDTEEKLEWCTLGLRLKFLNDCRL